MTYIKAGYGFNVGQDFARATKDLPVRIVERRGSDVVGYIDRQPDSKLGFLRIGGHPQDGIRVRTIVQAIGEEV